MNHTPQEVILLYEKHEQFLKECSTSLQKDELWAELQQELHCVQWEVEVSNVSAGGDNDFVIEGKVSVPERSRWGRVRFIEMQFKAFLSNSEILPSGYTKDLRGQLLTLKSGQRVRVEGSLSCDYNPYSFSCNSFMMNPARLVD